LASLGLPTFPLPEPEYSNKQPRDLEPFALALNDLTPERNAELEALLAGKTIPEIQVLMDEIQLTSQELVTYNVSRIDQNDIDKLNSLNVFEIESCPHDWLFPQCAALVENRSLRL
jgi:hypothetical protein